MESKIPDQIRTPHTYSSWLGQEIIEFFLPLFDKDGDQVDIYVTDSSEGYVLRDDEFITVYPFLIIR